MATKTKPPGPKTPPGGNGYAPVRAVLYARVSTEEQRERQSIETQIDYARQYCQREGLFIVGVYKDESVSGIVPFEEREAGQSLLEDARKKKFDLVLVYKIDRLGRDTRLTLTTIHHLETLGVDIRSLTEPFDTSAPHGRFMFTIFASVAQLERDNIRERSMAGTSRVAKTGKWMGGIVPYGYKVGEDRHIEVNEDSIPGTNIPEAEVVRMIYRWTGEEKLSTLKIAQKLNSMGIPAHYAKDGRQLLRGKRRARTSGKWHPHRIGNLIHNKTYMGIHEYGKRTKDPHKELIRREVPAIVSPELWHKAQETLRQNFFWAGRNVKRDYLLRGLIRCGFCGRNWTGCDLNKGKRYYRCNAKLMHVKMVFGSCPSRYLRTEWLEKVVWGTLQDWILNHTDLEDSLTEALGEYEKKRQGSLATMGSMRANLQLKDEERFRVVEAYRKGLLNSGDLERQLTAIQEERMHLEGAVEDLERKLDLDIAPGDAISHVQQQLDSFQAAVRNGGVSFQEKRRIMETCVKEVRVNLKGKTPEIKLKETIPLRENAGSGLSPLAARMTVWVRPGYEARTDQPGGEEGTLQIVYRFSFPPKSKELVSIANHTDKDS